jgi:hypothetical protein
VPNYLVESYAPHRHPVVDDACERARQVGQLEDGVRYVRTTFIPEDETILHLFEASSTEALQRALRLASLQHERIVEAIEDTGSDQVAK